MRRHRLFFVLMQPETTHARDVNLKWQHWICGGTVLALIALGYDSGAIDGLVPTSNIEGLLDQYYWKETFIDLNKEFFLN